MPGAGTRRSGGCRATGCSTALPRISVLSCGRGGRRMSRSSGCSRGINCSASRVNVGRPRISHGHERMDETTTGRRTGNSLCGSRGSTKGGEPAGRRLAARIASVSGNQVSASRTKPNTEPPDQGGSFLSHSPHAYLPPRHNTYPAGPCAAEYNLSMEQIEPGSAREKGRNTHPHDLAIAGGWLSDRDAL